MLLIYKKTFIDKSYFWALLHGFLAKNNAIYSEKYVKHKRVFCVYNVGIVGEQVWTRMLEIQT